MVNSLDQRKKSNVSLSQVGNQWPREGKEWADLKLMYVYAYGWGHLKPE